MTLSRKQGKKKKEQWKVRCMLSSRLKHDQDWILRVDSVRGIAVWTPLMTHVQVDLGELPGAQVKH